MGIRLALAFSLATVLLVAGCGTPPPSKAPTPVSKTTESSSVSEPTQAVPQLEEIKPVTEAEVRDFMAKMAASKDPPSDGLMELKPLLSQIAAAMGSAEVRTAWESWSSGRTEKQVEDGLAKRDKPSAADKKLVDAFDPAAEKLWYAFGPLGMSGQGGTVKVSVDGGSATISRSPGKPGTMGYVFARGEGGGLVLVGLDPELLKQALAQ
jgi:hypothetical protein